MEIKFNTDVFNMPNNKSLLLKLSDGSYAVGYTTLSDGLEPEGVESTYDMSSVVFSGKVVGYVVIVEGK